MTELKTSKALKFFISYQNNWILETQSIPTSDELWQHFLIMPDKEFDAYLNGEPYTEREELRDDVADDQTLEKAELIKTEREERKSKNKNKKSNQLKIF